jgi:hypothetical protein
MKRIACLLLLILSLSLFLPTAVKAQPNVNLTLATDNPLYYGTSTVTVSGSLRQNNNPVTDGLVGLQITDSNENTIVMRTLKTGTSTPTGLVTQISDAYLSDLSANQLTNINAGELAYFSIKLINNNQNPQNMIVTINIFDSQEIPIGFISGQCSLIAGQSGIATLSIQITNNAHIGLAHGYANVYSNLPIDGGFPIGDEKSFEFTINDGLSEPKNAATVTGKQQGSYSFMFRLPAKGATDSNFNVVASCSYLGSEVSKNASFKGTFADFNNDGQVDYNDVLFFVSSYIKYNQNNPLFTPQCDFDRDGALTYKDAVQLVSCYIVYVRNMI